MMRVVAILLLAGTLIAPTRARADLFGGDVVVLTQILAQAVMQLAKLKEMLGTAQGHLDLIKDINRGINDSLRLLKTIEPNLDPGIYKDWTTVQEALAHLQRIYGIAIDSPEAKIQKDTDQGVAEAIAFNNSYYKYTRELDAVGERIKSASHDVSPGGAQKLTAQALGLVIQVLNQNLRAQATSLKLQAQALALENKRDKAETRHFLEASQGLRQAMKNERVHFQVPRF